jgi:16S rRNA (cytidine1402-2'-O)-methyltransferase
MPGSLFVVATPIGNLEDFTFRALRTLREVDLIAAEDTRRTSHLLAHYAVEKPLVSLREHNEVREAPRLVARMIQGTSIALVTDAGTPGISDPGSRLVAEARRAGIQVVPVPGPSAVTTALSVCGLSGDGFAFMGFPPSSGAARERWMDAVVDESRLTVFFESPHRIRRTLTDLRSISGNRPICICREITKRHEIFVEWDKTDESLTEIREQGEFVLILGAIDDHSPKSIDNAAIVELFGLMTKSGTLSGDDAEKAVAGVLDIPLPQVKKAIKKARIAARRVEEGEP